ncbi:general transcription factor ii-i repeat domain-containing 2-like protein [Plakobranchus ocellatus]|uniref:General transcription factor ii-i repeat domain-containing 2-like protein n=1 Tax=Plakobranchus ocellatus TaxID=259542 RepID=A0AAV4CAV7_9GAST|nr:general transcription factor ii-i repeat domain-containing 2-like protein [Plakobranchus ocellatus]
MLKSLERLAIIGKIEADLKPSGPPSGQGAGGGARARERKVPSYFRASLLSTVLPTRQLLYFGYRTKNTEHPELADSEMLLKVYYLMDMTEHLNQLNLKRQGVEIAYNLIPATSSVCI